MSRIDRWALAILVSIGTAATAVEGQKLARAQGPPKPIVPDAAASAEFENLGGYLAYASERLGFSYTIEERGRADSGITPIASIRQFDVAADLKSIDDFIEHCNAALRGVTVMRAEGNTPVLHFRSRDLPKDGPLDRRISIDQFRGTLLELLKAIDAKTDGRIIPYRGRGFPVLDLGDTTTVVKVSADDAKVRDVLTQAIPQGGYKRYAWTAISNAEGDVVEVRYRGFEPTYEERILADEGTVGYLREMGRRLDCYFTIEDDRSLKEPPPWIVHESPFFSLEFDIGSIDELITSLDRTFNTRSNPVAGGPPTIRQERVRVLRNQSERRVIHLVRASLLENPYVMDERETLDHWDRLGLVPHTIGKKLEGRIETFGTVQIPYLRSGESPYVNLSLSAAKVRDLLTAASPLDGQRRILWGAAKYEQDGKVRVKVAYEGVSDDVAELLGYDKGKPPTASP